MLTKIFKNQLSSIIEWKDQDINVLWHKFPSQKNEIKNASKLIVAPGQGCVIVYEGKIENIINNEGIYNLKTDNHPFITNLLRLRTSFESEHKLYIYFYKKTEILNQKWGTPMYIKYIDPKYNFPVELGANGNFSYKIEDIHQFFTNVVGSKENYTVTEAREIIVNRFPQQITSLMAQLKISYQEIDSQLNLISKELSNNLNAELTTLGFKLTDLKLSGTNFDDATKERIRQIADITTQSQAASEGGLSYSELEKLRALRDAAKNEGGLAGAGLQLGAGMELGKLFKDNVDNTLSDKNNDSVDKLRKLKLLLTEGIITQEEFDAKKHEILSNL